MDKYSVGPDELDEYDYDYITNLNLKWFVYHYGVGSYEGWGEAIGYDGENLFLFNLGHCSCYGPLEGQPDKIKVADFLSDKVCLDESEHELVNQKVNELLKLEASSNYSI